jgi:hypothetical protein
MNIIQPLQRKILFHLAPAPAIQPNFLLIFFIFLPNILLNNC